MGKKINSVLAGLVFVVVTFLVVGSAEAFCVYNNADRVVEVKQTEGGDFKKRVGSERECCNWENKSCNKGGKRDSIIRFDVYYKVSDHRIIPEDVYICKDFPIKAGGWLTVTGNKKDGYKCEAHYQP